MKKLLLSLACLAAVTCQAQLLTAAKFSGEYMGIATPVRWYCFDRVIVNAFVYPDGIIFVYVYGYDFGLALQGSGTVDAKGKFIVQLNNGHLVVGKVAKSGTVRGTLYADSCKATFTALRQYRDAYDPSLP